MEFLYILFFLFVLLRFVLVLRDGRLSRSFKINSLLALLAYFVWCGVGVALVLALAVPASDGLEAPGVWPAVLLLLAWIGLGMVWLIRLAPRRREPPGWLLRPWAGVDLALLGIIAAALLSLALGR